MADALLELDFDFDLEEIDLEEIDLPVIDLSKIELGEFNLDFLGEIDLFPDFSE